MNTGFYGKVASRGDFVSRGLPQSFIKPWDAWLAAGLLASQEQLGGQWLDAYLFSPLWRFAMAPGVCGPQAVVGVLMPSIDRVGRYFPLTVAQLIGERQSLGALVSGPDNWFEGVEALLLDTLEANATFEALDRGLQALGCCPTQERQASHHVASLLRDDALTPEQRGTTLADLACHGRSLWWGKGSEHISPGLLHCHGLPAATDFGTFLLGQGAKT